MGVDWQYGPVTSLESVRYSIRYGEKESLLARADKGLLVVALNDTKEKTCQLLETDPEVIALAAKIKQSPSPEGMARFVALIERKIPKFHYDLPNSAGNAFWVKPSGNDIVTANQYVQMDCVREAAHTGTIITCLKDKGYLSQDTTWEYAFNGMHWAPVIFQQGKSVEESPGFIIDSWLVSPGVQAPVFTSHKEWKQHSGRLLTFDMELEKEQCAAFEKQPSGLNRPGLAREFDQGFLSRWQQEHVEEPWRQNFPIVRVGEMVDAMFGEMVDAMFHEPQDHSHKSAVLAVINETLAARQVKGEPYIPLTQQDMDGDKEALKRKLTQAIINAYPDGPDEVGMFLKDIQTKPGLPENHPLKTYKGREFGNVIRSDVRVASHGIAALVRGVSNEGQQDFLTQKYFLGDPPLLPATEMNPNFFKSLRDRVAHIIKVDAKRATILNEAGLSSDKIAQTSNFEELKPLLTKFYEIYQVDTKKVQERVAQENIGNIIFYADLDSDGKINPQEKTLIADMLRTSPKTLALFETMKDITNVREMITHMEKSISSLPVKPPMQENQK